MEKKHSFGQLLGTSTLLVFALSFAAFNIQAAEKGAAFGTNILSQPKPISVITKNVKTLRTPSAPALAKVRGYAVAAATISLGTEEGNTTKGNEILPPRKPGDENQLPINRLRAIGGDRNEPKEPRDHPTGTNPFNSPSDKGPKQSDENQDKKLSSTLTDTEISCIVTALETRDGSLLTALDIYSSALKTAITTRTTALKSAWALTDRAERRTALRKAWGDFKKSASTARNDFRKAKLDAWKKWSTDRKACAPTAPADDNTNASVDVTL